MSEMLGLDSDTQNSYFGLMLRELGRFQNHQVYRSYDSNRNNKSNQIKFAICKNLIRVISFNCKKRYQ